MNVLDGLPTLSRGSHDPDSGKACVMEYVALLAGEAWSDGPTCTHPSLAWHARRANDSLNDEDRHLLVPMILRLFGTNEPVNEMDFHLAKSRVTAKYNMSFSGCHSENPTKLVKLLSDLIDIYDRLSGRAAPEELTDDDMALLNSVSAT